MFFLACRGLHIIPLDLNHLPVVAVFGVGAKAHKGNGVVDSSGGFGTHLLGNETVACRPVIRTHKSSNGDGSMLAKELGKELCIYLSPHSPSCEDPELACVTRA